MSNKQEVLSKELESFYEILEIEEEASTEEIQKAYRQKVREYPPEERPEEFKKVREAYDVLRDPKIRVEYAHRKKYGDRVKELVDEGFTAMHNEEFERALDLFSEAQDIHPTYINLYRYGASAGRVLDDEDIIEEQIEKMESNFPKEAQFSDYVDKAGVYAYLGMEEETIEALSKAEVLATKKDREAIDSVYVDLYFFKGEHRKMIDFLEKKMLPPIQDQTIEDLPHIIRWINGNIDTNQWSVKPKMKKRIKTLLQAVEDEDKEYMLFVLKKEFHDYMKMSRFRQGQFYLDLIFLEEKTPFIREHRKELANLVKLEKEYDRLFDDEKIFPLVVMQAHEFYVEDYIPHEDPEELKARHSDLFDKYAHMDEEYAAGIVRLKKRYPNLYRHYKEEWDALFAEKTRDLNREARRRLR